MVRLVAAFCFALAAGSSAAQEVRDTPRMAEWTGPEGETVAALPLAEVAITETLLDVEIDGTDYRLDALIVAPIAAQAGDMRPAIVISHGNPRKLSDQRNVRLYRYAHLAEEFARRGYVAYVIARRGFARSTGDYAEWYTRDCDATVAAGYIRAGLAGAEDYGAVLRLAAADPRVDPGLLVTLGISGGGFASLALASEAPEGLRGVINFSGGRGSSDDFENCNAAALAEAFARFGTAEAVPSLWLYSSADRFFWPEMVNAHFDAFGGPARLVMFGPVPHAEDGHRLYQRAGTHMWRPEIDRFLHEIGMPTWDGPPGDPLDLDIAAPAGTGAKGAAQWTEFLGSEFHRAFAVGADGAFGWASGYPSPEAAAAKALEVCQKGEGAACRLHMLNETLQ